MDRQRVLAALKVAECGSINQAATQLFMSVQGVKNAIDALERDELGCQLFVRTNKGVTLTEAGRLFCAEAPGLLAQMDNFSRRVRESLPQALRISIWENKEIPILDEICANYCLSEQEEPLLFVPETERRILDDIEEGVADIGFQAREVGPFDEARLAYASVGILMTFECVVAPNHPLAHLDRPLAPDDLTAFDVALVGNFNDAATRKESRHFSLTFNEVIPYERYRIMNFCLRGGVCVCDEYLARSLASLASLPMDWIEPVDILVAHRPDPSPSVLHFIDIARETTARPRR